MPKDMGGAHCQRKADILILATENTSKTSLSIQAL